MEFLKSHYEKVVLSVVLLGVAAAALFLTLEVGRVQAGLDEQLQSISARRPKELQPLDLTNNLQVLGRLSQVPQLELDGPHNTFNPGTWDRAGDQLRRKAGRGWLDLLEISEIKPLNLIIQFAGVAGLSDSPRYQFNVTREYESQISKRRPTITSLTPGTKNDLFILRDIKGAPSAPSELICELVEDSRLISVTPDQPYVETVGYAADLRYDGKDLKEKRVDETLNLSGATYKIVAIGKEELVVSAPNQVRTTLRPKPVH